MRLSLFISFLLFANQPGRAAHQPDTSGVITRQHAVRLHIGTTGPGLFYNRQLSSAKRLWLRVGGQYIAYRQPIRVNVSSESYITVDPDFMIGLAQAGLMWQPFRRGSFYLAGGLGYTWHPHLGAVVTTDKKLNLGGLELLPEDVGTVSLAVRWRPVVGYFGFGFGRPVPRRRWGVGVELGAFYLGRPRVDLAYEGFLETTNLSEQVPVVERNLSNYRYLPSLNFTLTYRLP
ncbi:hypothetical protein [Spirosoma montaniterrae]|uniref:hypothetical protein n=1 Tax=Spirosoma montaniterrae TaxID=1178516 RepID=UPI001E4E2AE3|nr:hypothetical protein [Spirosoma montaniterrae]